MSAADPNVVDPASRREIISFGKNAGNHNGGTIAFGPDGYLYLAPGRRRQRQRRRRQPHRAGRQRAEPDHAAGQDDPHRPAQPVADDRQPRPRQHQRPIPHSRRQSVPRRRRRCRKSTPSASATRTASPSTALNGELILADVGQNNIEEIDRVTLGGNYGWAVKEGDVSVQSRERHDRRRRRAITAPACPPGLIDPISGTLGTLQYDHERRHLDHRRLRLPRHGDPRAGRQVRLRRPGASANVADPRSTAGCSTPTCRPA